MRKQLQPDHQFHGGRRHVLLNVLASYGAFLTQAASAFVVTPITVRGLGVNQYGLLTLVTAIAGYFGVVELGLGASITRATAALGSAGDTAGLRVMLASALRTYVRLALAGILILTLALLLLPSIVPSTDALSVRFSLAVLGAGQIVALNGTAYSALLIGLGRFRQLAYVTVPLSIVSLAGQALAAATTHAVSTVALLSAICSVLQVILIRTFARRRLGLTTSLRMADGPTARKLLKFGALNSVISISAVFAYGLDPVIVGATISTAAVAAYGIAVKAAGALISLSSRGADLLIPSYADLNLRHRDDRVFQLYLRSLEITYLVALPAVGFTFAALPFLLLKWIGQVPAGTVLVGRILMLALLSSIPGFSAFKALSGINKLGFLAVAAVADSLVNAAGGVVLVHLVGLSGPALATLVTSIVYDVVVVPLYLTRTCSSSPKLLFTSFRRVITLGLATAIPAVCLSRVPQDLGWVAIRGALILTVYALTASITYRRAWPKVIAAVRARFSALPAR